MARVTDPLFSRSASGRIGADLLFRGGKAGPRVSRPPDPRRTNQAPASAAQANVRDNYSAAATAWRALTPGEREQWHADAQESGRNLHGWALFLSFWRGGIVRPRIMQWGAPTSQWGNSQNWG